MYYSSPARRAFRLSPTPLPITKSNCEKPPRLGQSCQCQTKRTRRENAFQYNSCPSGAKFFLNWTGLRLYARGAADSPASDSASTMLLSDLPIGVLLLFPFFDAFRGLLAR